MDEAVLEQRLAEEMLDGWQVVSTGGGFMVTTSWRLPNDERIDIYVRRVADRNDLFLVTDGGALANFLFASGIDLRRDDGDMQVLHAIVARSNAGISDYQIVKGANNEDLPRSIRFMVEAVKEGAFAFWHKLP